MHARALAIPLAIACSALALCGEPGGGWTRLNVPGAWEDASPRYASLDGFAWYRAKVVVPQGWSGGDLELLVEHVDNAHEAFWNGVRVGSAGSLPPAYRNGVEAVSRHRIPASSVKAGAANLLAIRVYDEGGRGGFKGAAPAVLKGDEAIALAGAWEFHPATIRRGGTPRTAAVHRSAPSSMRARWRGPLRSRAGRAPRARRRAARDANLRRPRGRPRPGEPTVRQPVSISFDERGRLWVVQYLQYPQPAGLTMLSHDGVWRAHYDKVPAPPPNHVRGLDKVTIHEDADGDGAFEKETVFVDGLNIATSAAGGAGECGS
jgi:hypothetical protein